MIVGSLWSINGNSHSFSGVPNAIVNLRIYGLHSFMYNFEVRKHDHIHNLSNLRTRLVLSCTISKENLLELIIKGYFRNCL